MAEDKEEECFRDLEKNIWIKKVVEYLVKIEIILTQLNWVAYVATIQNDLVTGIESNIYFEEILTYLLGFRFLATDESQDVFVYYIDEDWICEFKLCYLP